MACIVLPVDVVGVNAGGDQCGMHLCGRLCGLRRCQCRCSWDASAFHVNRVGLCIALAKGLTVLIVNGWLALAVDVDWHICGSRGGTLAAHLSAGSGHWLLMWICVHTWQSRGTLGPNVACSFSWWR